jgi:hypothetical protein
MKSRNTLRGRYRKRGNMLDPSGLLEPKNRREQELTVLYIIAVANKTSEYAVKVMGKFMHRTSEYELPFNAILELWRVDALETIMRECKIAPYKWKYKAFKHAALVGTRGNVQRDLKTVTPDEWSNVGGAKVGIGPKSARYICMCLDPEHARYAALDTHVLKWLRHVGYKAPKSTPPAGKNYNDLEKIFLRECDKRGRKPAEFDLEIWEAYKYGGSIPQ